MTYIHCSLYNTYMYMYSEDVSEGCLFNFFRNESVCQVILCLNLSFIDRAVKYVFYIKCFSCFVSRYIHVYCFCGMSSWILFKKLFITFLVCHDKAGCIFTPTPKGTNLGNNLTNILFLSL